MLFLPDAARRAAAQAEALILVLAEAQAPQAEVHTQAVRAEVLLQSLQAVLKAATLQSHTHVPQAALPVLTPAAAKAARVQAAKILKAVPQEPKPALTTKLSLKKPGKAARHTKVKALQPAPSNRRMLRSIPRHIKLNPLADQNTFQLAIATITSATIYLIDLEVTVIWAQAADGWFIMPWPMLLC